jgi:hypothetical protein
VCHFFNHPLLALSRDVELRLDFTRRTNCCDIPGPVVLYHRKSQIFFVSSYQRCLLVPGTDSTYDRQDVQLLPSSVCTQGLSLLPNINTSRISCESHHPVQLPLCVQHVLPQQRSAPFLSLRFPAKCNVGDVDTKWFNKRLDCVEIVTAIDWDGRVQLHVSDYAILECWL